MAPRALFITLFLLAATSLHAAGAPSRIVSLAPGMTEMLYALGLHDSIVGVTTYCDYPPEARLKPKIGGMSNPSLEAIVALRPDIVVLTTDGNPKEIETKIRSLGIGTYVFRARRMSELPEAVERLGAELGVPGRAAALASEIRARLDAYRRFGEGVSNPQKALFVVWPEPLIVAGRDTLIDDGIKMLGHGNIASAGMTSYPKYSIEEVLVQSPDIILVGGMGQVDMRGVSAGLLQRLASTPAVREGKVYYVGDGLMRYGPRVVEGMDELMEIFREAQAEK